MASAHQNTQGLMQKFRSVLLNTSGTHKVAENRFDDDISHILLRIKMIHLMHRENDVISHTIKQ